MGRAMQTLRADMLVATGSRLLELSRHEDGTGAQAVWGFMLVTAVEMRTAEGGRNRKDSGM